MHPAHGLMIGDVQQVIASAIGAETITTTVVGRERYNVSLRYPRDVRSDPQAIGSEVLVPLESGASVPPGQVAKVKLVQGPASIRTENAQLAAYIYIDARERDLASYVEDARRAVAEKVSFPQGDYAVWSGQFEYYERAKQRLMIVVPLTLVIILLLLYLNFRRPARRRSPCPTSWLRRPMTSCCSLQPRYTKAQCIGDDG